MSQRIFALVVCIDQYQSDEIRSLQGCVKDGESIRDILLQYFKDAQVCLLRDDRATQAGILKSFKEHLTDNPDIARDDPIVVYFACKGRRLVASPGSLARDLDVLVPYDYCDEVSGISDITVHALLCDLAQKKGSNISLIIDSSFSFSIPRGKIAHRSETSPVPLSHISAAWQGDSAQYAGFFGESPMPYVLLAACHPCEIALESSNGGVFTQSLIAKMREKKTITYRELVIGLKFRGQRPICSGLQPDRLLFSIPTDSRISRLRVFFGCHVELERSPNDDFVRVDLKEEASIALRSASDGGLIIERLDGLVGQYAGRDVVIPAEYSDCIHILLNKIAHFHHYLCLEPSRQHTSSSKKIQRQNTRPLIKIYQFRCTEDGKILGWKSMNMLRNGVARFDPLVADRACGLRITNRSDQKMYPYLLCFDPATYTSMHTPSPSDRWALPLEARRVRSASSFTVGFGKAGGTPIQFTVDATQTDRDAAFFKVILCQNPVDLSYMLQPHPLTSSDVSPVAWNVQPSAPAQITGCWDTTVATMSLRLNYRPISYKKRLAHIFRVDPCSY